VTLEEILSQLWADKNAVRGDGFGYAGSLISTYKKAITTLEDLQGKLKETPPPAEAESLIAANPDCFGFGVRITHLSVSAAKFTPVV
jgi:hypothetical protein